APNRRFSSAAAQVASPRLAARFNPSYRLKWRPRAQVSIYMKHFGTIDTLRKRTFVARGKVRTKIWRKRKIAIGLSFNSSDLSKKRR
ncbi:MAG TPA: hypothetical protein VIH87_10205, partial [Methylocella sp.]